MPITSEYNNAMQEFNDLTYMTSKQHRKSTEARLIRGHADLEKIKEKLSTCMPFSLEPSLKNIITGLVANESMNVHEYETVGKEIIEKMIGKHVFEITYKWEDQAKTLADEPTIIFAQGQTIDPALLFQSFLVLSKTRDLSLEDVISYELNPFTTALFEAKEMFRKADKPRLALAVAEYSCKTSKEAIVDSTPLTEQYVLDGGSLIHHLPWKRVIVMVSLNRIMLEFTIRH